MPKHVFLGRTVITPAVEERVPVDRLNECLALHQQGNWGIVDAADRALNNEQLLEDGRVMSSWQIDVTKPSDGCDDNAFWIITDGSAAINYAQTGIITTVLLPEDY